MVGDPDDGLVAFVAHHVDLVLDVQNRLAVFLAGRVPDLAFHRAGVPFVPVLAQIGKLHPLLSVSIHRYGTHELLLPPSLGAAVQAVGSVVGMQGVGLAVEVVDPCVFDAVRGPADGLAEVGRVVGFVVADVREGQDDVLTLDFEFLDGGSVGEEGEGRFG